METASKVESAVIKTPAGEIDQFEYCKVNIPFGGQPYVTYTVYRSKDKENNLKSLVEVLECDDEETAQKVVEFLNSVPVRFPRC